MTQGVKMKNHQYTDEEFNMRWRFAKQIIRFWQRFVTSQKVRVFVIASEAKQSL